MAGKSTLDPENYSAGTRRRRSQKGHDVGSLGPGDSSDTGSDLAGLQPNSEEMSFARGADEDSPDGHVNDIDTDRIITAEEAALGGGLDQAEEAQLGARDNEIAPEAESIPPSDLLGSSDIQPQSDLFSEEDRHRRVADAAYYRAERRGFAPGQEYEDWIAAESDMDSGNKDR